MKKKFYPLVDGIDLRNALGFDSLRDFIDVEGQNTCVEMSIEDDEIEYEISEAEAWAQKEGDPFAENYARQLKNWRKVVEYIRENYEVSDDMKTVFVRVWW
jgi:hypothetical protein